MGPHTSYLVCASPRSGSSLLCEALKSTGIAGRPEEYLWRGDEPFWRERWGVSSFDEYLASVIREGTTPNGVFGAKVMWTYFPDDVLPRLRQLPGLGHLPPHMLLGALFPNLHYIFVRRQDRVRQAVSWERAHQTGIWSQRVGERSEPARQPVFDFAAVDRLVRLIEVNEAAWRHFFGEAGGEPLEVVYEEFVRSYEETTLRVLDYLGIEAPPDLKISPPIQRQADSLSDDWARLYHLLKEEARPRPPRNAE